MNGLVKRLGVLVAGSTCLLFVKHSSAQVVQLPSISNFSYGGSVLVPDRGVATLGGNGYLSSGRISHGRPNSTAIGQTIVSGGGYVHGQIIDLDALDQQLRNSTQAHPMYTTRGRMSRMPVSQGAVASTYLSLLDNESPTRRRTLNDFHGGDYMMILSHPALVDRVTADKPAVLK